MLSKARSLTWGRGLIKGERYSKLLLAFGILASSYVIVQIAVLLPEPFRFAEFALVPIAGGSILVAVGMGLQLLTGSHNSPISAIPKLFSANWINFSLGALLTLYFAFIRPPLFNDYPIVVIGEWIVVVVGISIIFREIKGVTLNYYGQPRFVEWGKHIQNVELKTSTDFAYFMHIQDLFVNSGEKELMLVYYALQLRERGEPEREILRKAQQLLEYYQDRKAPLLAFPWARKKIQETNRKAREALLKKIVEEIT